MIPHPDKIMRRGEDAQFSNNKILVVADGIGAWAKVFNSNLKIGRN